MLGALRWTGRRRKRRPRANGCNHGATYSEAVCLEVAGRCDDKVLRAFAIARPPMRNMHAKLFASGALPCTRQRTIKKRAFCRRQRQSLGLSRRLDVFSATRQSRKPPWNAAASSFVFAQPRPINRGRHQRGSPVAAKTKRLLQPPSVAEMSSSFQGKLSGFAQRARLTRMRKAERSDIGLI